MIPTECKMPDLSKLELLQGNLLLQLTFGQGDSGLSHNMSIFRRVFIRLLDKAVLEYRQARTAIVAQIEEDKRPTKEMKATGRIIYIFAFVDHLENCLNAVRRLLRILDRIKNEPTGPAIPRLTRRLIETQRQPIIDFRDIIEHIDERINNDEFGTGPVMLKPAHDTASVQIGCCYLRLDDLARIIENLHEIASYLVTYSDSKPESDGTIT